MRHFKGPLQGLQYLISKSQLFGGNTLSFHVMFNVKCKQLFKGACPAQAQHMTYDLLRNTAFNASHNVVI